MISVAMNRPLATLGLCAASLLLVACATPVPVDTAASPAQNVTPGSKAVAARSTGSDREQAISAYRDYLASYPDGPERDRVTRRLADLLLERGGEPQVYAEAIAYYESLLTADPQSAESTELLYQLSRAYQESGRSQEALASIDTLLARKTDVEARLYADTRFRQGELWFSEGNYADAQDAYREIVAMGPSVAAYEAALYKLGWSLFKQERYAEALTPLLSLLDLKLGPVEESSAQGPAQTAADREQMADLYRVICASFAQLDGVDSVDNYFQKIGRRGYQQQVYLELAQWYVEQERVSDAALTWLLVAQRDPQAPLAPELTARAIELYQQAGFQERALTTQKQYATDYALDTGFWTLHSPADFSSAVALLQSSLQDLARHYHEQARERTDLGAAQEAEHWYRRYLLFFSDSEAAPEMNMQLAELLFEGGNYQQAADAYDRTARSAGKPALSAEAALGALRAIDLAMGDADASERAALGARAAADAVYFLRHHPQHPAAEDVLVQTGSALLEQQQYALALQTGEKIAADLGPVSAAKEMPATTPQSILLRQLGWSLQAQALFAMEDYAGATAAYREALLLAGEADARRPALLEGYAVATYRQAGQANTAGDHTTALALYRQAAQAAPTADIRTKSEYDAATLMLAQESWPGAIAALQQFRADYPDDPLQGQVNRRLAYAYDSSGDMAGAASEYLRLGLDKQQEGAVQSEALLKAADLFVQLDETEQAISTRETYLQRFPQPTDTAVYVMQELADVEEARGDSARRQHWLQAIVRLDQNSPSAVTRGPAASAALQLAEYPLAAFRRVKLEDPVQQNLARKIEAMKRALQAFETAIDFGVATVTSAANYHIATMYDELGSALLSSPRPVNLTTEALAEYDLLLAEKAAPFQQQAIELYLRNADSHTGASRDPWVAKSLQQLKRLQAAR